MLVGWTQGVALVGLVFGAITPSFDAFDSDGVRDMLERIGGAGAFRDTMVAAIYSVIAVVGHLFRGRGRRSRRT